MYKRIAASPRSATCALLDEYKITATTRRNASRKSRSFYIAPYYMDAMDVTWMKYHTALPTTSTTSSRSTDIETPPQRVEYAANVPRTHAPRAAQRAQAAARLSRLNAKLVYPWGRRTATSLATLPIGRAHRIMIQS